MTALRWQASQQWHTTKGSLLALVNSQMKLVDLVQAHREELDEEIRLAEEEGYMSVAETREFLLRHHIHSTCDLTVEEIKAIYEGKEMTAKGIETLKQKEYLTIEEMQALLLNMVDEEYSKP